MFLALCWCGDSVLFDEGSWNQTVKEIVTVACVYLAFISLVISTDWPKNFCNRMRLVGWCHCAKGYFSGKWYGAHFTGWRGWEYDSVLVESLANLWMHDEAWVKFILVWPNLTKQSNMECGMAWPQNLPNIKRFCGMVKWEKNDRIFLIRAENIPFLAFFHLSFFIDFLVEFWMGLKDSCWLVAMTTRISPFIGRQFHFFFDRLKVIFWKGLEDLF